MPRKAPTITTMHPDDMSYVDKYQVVLKVAAQSSVRHSLCSVPQHILATQFYSTAIVQTTHARLVCMYGNANMKSSMYTIRCLKVKIRKQIITHRRYLNAHLLPWHSLADISATLCGYNAHLFI